jgi:hypothetical protein
MVQKTLQAIFIAVLLAPFVALALDPPPGRVEFPFETTLILTDEDIDIHGPFVVKELKENSVMDQTGHLCSRRGDITLGELRNVAVPKYLTDTSAVIAT